MSTNVVPTSPERLRGVSRFPRWRSGLVGVCLSFLAAIASADEPPIQNRPANFSGAVGTFRVRTEAQPTRLLRDEALTFTVRITAEGSFKAPPKRPDLKALPAFTQRFHVEPLTDPPGDGPEWRYVYRLRPREPGVDAVPSLPLVYFKPSKSPGGRGSYQTARADAIAIQIAEPPPPPVTDVPPSFTPPASARVLVEGRAVLARPWSLPIAGQGIFALALAGPPIFCLGWYLVWRRLYPDAAKVIRQRRSRAARLALQRLERGRRLAPAPQADHAAAALVGYLRQRLDLAPAEPTPDEAAAPLRAAGCAEEIAHRVRLFLRDRDRVCFGEGDDDEPRPWIDQAAALVADLEAALEESLTRPHEATDPLAPVAGLVLVCLGAALLGSTGCSSSADADRDLLNEAETRFHAGLTRGDQPGESQQHFQAAAAAYEQLRLQGYASAALASNLGNAYLLAGDLPRAILTFRQGVEAFPADGSLRNQLDEARALVVYPTGDRLGQPIDDYGPPWLVWLVTMIVIVAFGLYTLGCLAFTRWLMIRKRAALGAALASLVAGAALFGTWLVLAMPRWAEAEQPVAVIADDGVLLRRGNALSYPPRYDAPVNRGVEARLLAERGSWVKLRLAGGEIGWVKALYVVR